MRLVNLGKGLAALAVISLLATGCASSTSSGSTETDYCVNGSGMVVDPANCNTQGSTNTPLFWIVISHNTYRPGDTVAATEHQIPADDPDARAKAGLPKTGGIPAEEVQPPPEYRAPAPEEPPVEVHDPPPPPEEVK